MKKIGKLRVSYTVYTPSTTYQPFFVINLLEFDVICSMPSFLGYLSSTLSHLVSQLERAGVQAWLMDSFDSRLLAKTAAGIEKFALKPWQLNTADTN